MHFRGSTNIDSVKSAIGLWRTCASASGITQCFNFPSTCLDELPEALPTCHKILVARAFVTIACIISPLSALCLILCAVISTDSNRIVITISKLLPFVSLVAGIIGVAVGIVFVTSSPLPYSFKLSDAAFLGITAVVVNMIGAILALCVR